ncbi:unnamed protein product [Fraxinus pennsylvanica]|uniref:Uncharacterized protein n=1 Tax=Fraxinus pennsylvanica TaxID=56036 RepID=A0AAD1ZBX1_9LAMI|nr:unnamed protein product [Fraxinus pennsylvanica]
MCRTGGVTTRSSEPSKKNLFLESLNLEDVDMRNTSSDSGKNGSSCEIQDKTLLNVWNMEFNIGQTSQKFIITHRVWGLRGDEISERLRFLLKNVIAFRCSGEFLENVADEYVNIPVLLYSVHSPDTSIDPKSRKRTITRNLHDAVSFSRLSAFCKLVIQVGLPSLSRRPSSQSSYTCGAMAVNDLVQMLAGQARQNMISILDLSMPAPTFTEVAEDVEDFQAVESMTVHGVYRAGRQRASITKVKDAEEVLGRMNLKTLATRCLKWLRH